MTGHVMRAEMVRAPRQSDGRTLPQLLRDNSHVYGGRPALKSKRLGIWQTKTWLEVYREATFAARGLAALGLAGERCSPSFRRISKSNLSLNWQRCRSAPLP